MSRCASIELRHAQTRRWGIQAFSQHVPLPDSAFPPECFLFAILVGRENAEISRASSVFHASRH